MVGVVVEISNEPGDYNVYVALEDYDDRRCAFRRDHLKVIGAGIKHSSMSPIAAESELHPQRRVVGFVALGLLALLAVTVFGLSQCGGSGGEQFSSAEQSFLDTVHRASPVENAPPFAAWPDNRTLVAEGHAICTDLQSHPRASYDQTWARLNGIDSYMSTYTMDQSLQLDAYAHMALCPAF
jgi:hypothetical protein